MLSSYTLNSGNLTEIITLLETNETSKFYMYLIYADSLFTPRSKVLFQYESDTPGEWFTIADMSRSKPASGVFNILDGKVRLKLINCNADTNINIELKPGEHPFVDPRS